MMTGFAMRLFPPRRGAGTVIAGIIPAAIPVKGAQPEPVVPAPNHPLSPAVSGPASVNENRNH
jgi:hypothetical protein